MKYLFAAVLVASSLRASAAAVADAAWLSRSRGGWCRPGRARRFTSPRAWLRVGVVVRPGRSPYGAVWAYGRCRPV